MNKSRKKGEKLSVNYGYMSKQRRHLSACVKLKDVEALMKFILLAVSQIRKYLTSDYYRY